MVRDPAGDRQAGALRAAGREPEALCPLTGSLSIATYTSVCHPAML